MKSKKESKHIPRGRKPALNNSLNLQSRKIWLMLGIILSVSFIAYLPVFHNSLLSWDDEGYITHNLLVHNFDLKGIFTHYVMGNYHPITMFVFALEYRIFGLNPAGYHAVNLILHLINVLLVYYTISHLCGRTVVALVAALLFGIHPMHVESVAWAAELKDLLYTLFFLLSLICYLNYSKDAKLKFYLLSLSFFLVSLLSKAMAASLPLALIMIDYFYKRNSLKLWIQKIPYFLLALIFGIIAIYAQKSSNSILQPSDISFPQRIIFASFGFINYLVKLLVPSQYCAFYPYPVIGGKVFIPGFYYIFPVLVIGLLSLVLYLLRFSRKIFFSLGFFTVTILLVLQLLPVGKAIMADRYGYIPSIGIFYLIGEGWLYLYHSKFRPLAYFLMAGIILFLPFKTYSRCRVWVNDFVFWTDVIDQYQTVEDAYYNRGIIYMNENKYDLALQDFNKALEIKPDFSNVFNNKGLLLMNIEKFQESLQNFDKAIISNPSNPDAYYNRGTLFHKLSKNPEAIADFNKAVELNPEYSAAYNNRGSVFFKEKRNAEAVRDFIKALELNPENAEAYYNYGVLLMDEKNPTKAIQQFNKAIELNPYYANAFNNRAIVYAEEKKYSESLNDFTTLISLQPDNYTAYNNRGMIYMNLKKNTEAFSDFNQAIQLNPRFAGAYNNLANLLFEEKNYPEAIRLYSSVINLLNNYPQAWYKRGLAEYNLGNKTAALLDLRQSASLGYKPAAEALSGIH